MEASPRSDCFVEEVGRKDVELFGGSGLYLVYDGFVLFLFFASEAAAEAATQDKEPLLSMSLSLSESLFTYYMLLPSELVEREKPDGDPGLARRGASMTLHLPYLMGGSESRRCNLRMVVMTRM